MESRTFTAAADDAGRRLDRVARRLFPGVPLAAIFRAIRTGAIRLNGRAVPPQARVAVGDEVSATGLARTAGLARPRASVEPIAAAQRLAPMVVHENQHALALCKPRGMPVHGPGSAEELVSSYLRDRRPGSLSFRPGPAHRLDRGTSGLLLFSCSLAGAQALTRLFRERGVLKEYLAVAAGRLATEETWEDLIGYDHKSRRSAAGGDQRAATRVVPLASAAGATLLACFPLTGRTHQIRAQAALHGHPLAGDELYGGGGGGYLLHALSLTLQESAPILGFTRLVAPPPPDFLERIAALFGETAIAAVRARRQPIC